MGREENMQIEDYVQYARNNRASDVHMTVGMPPLMRIMGELQPMMDSTPLTATDVETLVKSMITPEQNDKVNHGEDLDFAYMDGTGGRNRVNVYRQKGCYAMAMRLLNDTIPTIEQLELPPVLNKLALLQRGLVLVTGPTGSGKSTTLAAMIDVINRTKKVHILTLEEPIEYIHPHKMAMVNQREIGTDAYSFAHALRSALREDPDVILVGEMRDFETISLALTAAETGHLVFSTLHTMSASTTIDRIIDVFPPNQQQQVKVQLANSLKATIAQHLLPRIDTHSRCAAMEIMINNDAISNMIREGKSYHITSVMQTRPEAGMQTIEMSLSQLVVDKKISMDVALEHCNDPTLLRNLVQKQK